MHGHGYAPPPPPRRPRTAVLVLSRVFFVALALLSIGFLAWISTLYAAIVSRRPRDWWVFAATAAALVISFCFLATDDTDDFSTPAGTTGMIILLLNACVCAGYFLYADISHHRRPPHPGHVVAMPPPLAAGYGHPQPSYPYTPPPAAPVQTPVPPYQAAPPQHPGARPHRPGPRRTRRAQRLPAQPRRPRRPRRRPPGRKVTAAAGRVVAGRYELSTLIGQGGMGQVWTAYDRRLDRRVAVKLLRPDKVAGAEADELRRRFVRECRITAQVDHPGLVTVHDAGSEGEELFLVMQYVDGADLSDHLAEHDPYPWQWAVAVAAQLCAVLSAVHAVPIVHRDLKPRNVMVKQDGTVTVLDLGVASVMDADTTRLTHTGTPIGSPAYMAPEQAMGGAVGPYTDLYALGVLLHELLSGDVPFAGSTALGVLHRHLYEPPLPVRRIRPEVPEALEALVLRLLAKDPQHRPDSAQEVYEHLALLLPALGVPTGGPLDPTRPFVRPHAPGRTAPAPPRRNRPPYRPPPRPPSRTSPAPSTTSSASSARAASPRPSTSSARSCPPPPNSTANAPRSCALCAGSTRRPSWTTASTGAPCPNCAASPTNAPPRPARPTRSACATATTRPSAWNSSANRPPRSPSTGRCCRTTRTSTSPATPTWPTTSAAASATSCSPSATAPPPTTRWPGCCTTWSASTAPAIRSRPTSGARSSGWAGCTADHRRHADRARGGARSPDESLVQWVGQSRATA